MSGPKTKLGRAVFDAIDKAQGEMPEDEFFSGTYEALAVMTSALIAICGPSRTLACLDKVQRDYFTVVQNGHVR